MEYIRITKENIDKEHICCAMSDTATFLFLAAAYRIRPSPPIKAVISSR